MGRVRGASGSGFSGGDSCCSSAVGLKFAACFGSGPTSGLHKSIRTNIYLKR